METMNKKPRKGKANKCKCGKAVICDFHAQKWDKDQAKKIAQLAVKDFPTDAPNVKDTSLPYTEPIHIIKPPPHECDHRDCKILIGISLFLFLIAGIICEWQWHHWSTLWDEQKVVYLPSPVLHWTPDWLISMTRKCKDCQSDWRDQQATIKYLRAWKREHE